MKIPMPLNRGLIAQFSHKYRNEYPLAQIIFDTDECQSPGSTDPKFFFRNVACIDRFFSGDP